MKATKLTCLFLALLMSLSAMFAMTAYADAEGNDAKPKTEEATEADYTPALRDALGRFMDQVRDVIDHKVVVPGMTQESYKEFLSIYDECEKLLYDETATADIYRDAIRRLGEARANLHPATEPVTVDENASPMWNSLYLILNDARDTFEGRVTIPGMTDEAFDNFKKVFAECEALLNKSEATIDMLREGIQNLSKARLELSTSGNNTEPSETEPNEDGKNSTVTIGATAKQDSVKKDQNVKVKLHKKQVKASKLKNKTIKIKSAITVKKYKGKLTFKKVSGSKLIKVSKNGVITLKKSVCKKGALYAKIRVTASGNKKYNEFSEIVTVKINVK